MKIDIDLSKYLTQIQITRYLYARELIEELNNYLDRGYLIINEYGELISNKINLIQNNKPVFFYKTDSGKLYNILYSSKEETKNHFTNFKYIDPKHIYKVNIN
jgi:hypothetical protein